MSKPRHKPNELNIDFGPFCQQRPVPNQCLFQRVRSQMLKRRERMQHRRKPLEYERLQASLQQKLKQNAFNKEEQRVEMVMLDKCKNYFQFRRSRDNLYTPKPRDRMRGRPQTSCSSLHTASAGFMQQLKGVMEDCQSSHSDIKENMNLFGFYCKMMDRRLQGIRNAIQKKQRMI